MADAGQSVVQPGLPLHRFTVAEYERMGEVGIFGEDDRVELIDGVIIEMAPIGPGHAGKVILLNNRLAVLLAGRALIDPQNPVRLGDRSMPQPDLAVLRLRSDAYQLSHPTAADVLLVIEVSDSTLRFDRHVKAVEYARAGLPEYWMFNLPDRSIEVFRSPSEAGYQDVTTVRSGDRLSILLLPDVELDVADLLIVAGDETREGEAG